MPIIHDICFQETHENGPGRLALGRRDSSKSMSERRRARERETALGKAECERKERERAGADRWGKRERERARVPAVRPSVRPSPETHHAPSTFASPARSLQLQVGQTMVDLSSSSSLLFHSISTAWEREREGEREGNSPSPSVRPVLVGRSVGSFFFYAPPPLPPFPDVANSSEDNELIRTGHTMQENPFTFFAFIGIGPNVGRTRIWHSWCHLQRRILSFLPPHSPMPPPPKTATTPVAIVGGSARASERASGSRGSSQDGSEFSRITCC